MDAACFCSVAARIGTTGSARQPETVPVEPGRPIVSLSRRCSPVKERLICLKFRLREWASVKSASIPEGWRPTDGFRPLPPGRGATKEEPRPAAMTWSNE